MVLHHTHIDLPVSTVHTGKEWCYNNDDVGNNGNERRREMEKKQKKEEDGITINRKPVSLPPFLHSSEYFHDCM